MSCLNYGWFLVYWCISRSYLILQSNPLSGRCVNDVNEQDCGRFVQKPGALLGRLTRSANYSIILSLPENASSALCLVGNWIFQSGQIDPVCVIRPIDHFYRSTDLLLDLWATFCQSLKYPATLPKPLWPVCPSPGSNVSSSRIFLIGNLFPGKQGSSTS